MSFSTLHLQHWNGTWREGTEPEQTGIECRAKVISDELDTFPHLTGEETKTQESLVRQGPWQVDGSVGPLGLFLAWPFSLLLEGALLLFGDLLIPPFVRVLIADAPPPLPMST